MGYQKSLQHVLATIIFVLFLFGCGAPQATQVLPSATPIAATQTPIPASPTPIPPTLTLVSPTAPPTRAITLVTSPDQIIGTWNKGDSYIRFDKDGTFRQAGTLEKLENEPYAINSYQFEGTTMVITQISVSGVPSCDKKIGKYEIRLLGSSKIHIVPIMDECRARAGDISGVYEPVP